MAVLRTLLAIAVLAAVQLTTLSDGRAAVIWDEGVSGDLSDNQAAPNALALAAGTNSVIGNVGDSNARDWIALTVPAGQQLTGIILAAYVSNDAQGFTGVQSGASFVGSVNDPAAYLGYAHYGTAATNGALPPANLIGADLLPLMGDNTIAFGSQGFSGPLPSGTYTFLIQQLGALTAYQFDYLIAPVPEPSSGLLLAAAGLVWAGRGRLRAARRATSGSAD
jgi:hypothetical protein